jgi:hypothetical protein
MTMNAIAFTIPSSSSPLRGVTTTSFSSNPSSTLTSTSLFLTTKLLSQDDLAKPPNQKVIDTIEKVSSSSSSSSSSNSSNKNNNVIIIASDIAAKTGLSLSETKQSLSSLASLTRGDISVTKDGELLYTFPNNISSVLKSNSLRYKLTNVWKKDVWPKLFWGIRVSFGLFLFISIAAIFSTLIFVQTGGGGSSDDREDNNNRRGGGSVGGFGRYGVGDFLFDIFYPRPYLYSYNYGYYGRYDPYYIQDSGENDDDYDERKGIFEGIFSYIFGDGDPNRNLEAARLREASRVIRSNGGAVTAEQLAIFCDVDDPDDVMREDFSLSDEGFVLPIVSQLGGVPTVTDDGDIIYLFPDLQVSALEEEKQVDDIDFSLERVLMNRTGDSNRNINGSGNDMEYLQEMELEFNRNEGIGNILAGGLGVVNLVGALYLGQILSSPTLSGVQLAGWFGLVQSGYPLLLSYAILFNAIPVARKLYNEKVNANITKRNSARRKWLTYLKVSGPKLTRKLQAAKSFRQRMKRLGRGKDETVYDTRTSIEDLTAENEAKAMKRFDELLGE